MEQPDVRVETLGADDELVVVICRVPEIRCFDLAGAMLGCGTRELALRDVNGAPKHGHDCPCGDRTVAAAATMVRRVGLRPVLRGGSRGRTRGVLSFGVGLIAQRLSGGVDQHAAGHGTVEVGYPCQKSTSLPDETTPNHKSFTIVRARTDSVVAERLDPVAGGGIRDEPSIPWPEVNTLTLCHIEESGVLHHPHVDRSPVQRKMP